jgi:hypothetical protein
MITGKNLCRAPLAYAATQSFLRQTYDNKRLLIISDDPSWRETPLYALKDERIHQDITASPTSGSWTLGTLRNMALRWIQNNGGGLMMQWDDDDWYHPLRIETQVSQWSPGYCVTLLWQIRYSFLNNSAYALKYEKWHHGIPGTILCAAGEAGYNDDDRRHEDSHLIDARFNNRCVVIDNDLCHVPGPSLYLRFFHGANTWGEQHVMRTLAGERGRDQWKLEEPHHSYLAEVLRDYYFSPAQETA